MGEKYKALAQRLATVHNLNMAQSVLNWDRETAMPPLGDGARARQLATLARLSHEMFTAQETARLIEDARSEIEGMDYGADEASLVRVAQRDYDLLTRLPSEFVAELTRVTALAHNVWAEARKTSRFATFEPMLQQIMDLMVEGASCLGYKDHPYDALLGQYDSGMTTSLVRDIFAAHQPALVDLIAAVRAAPQVDDSFLYQDFDIDKQRQFGLKMTEAFGYDYQRGIQAISVHPFCQSFSSNDVRITTRFDPQFVGSALFGFFHETGHAMYEQGVAQNLDDNILAGGTSLSVHESQSRLWENIVGRSKGFWSWALPQLQEVFPQLKGVGLDQFHRGINTVRNSFIRVEADEATYNLHVILRFEIEQDLVSGKLPVSQVRDAWNSRFEQFFGMTPPDDAQGVLQDVHWSAGLVGYFPTYALGNLLSVQYYNQALKAHPSIPDEIANGKFDTLLRWLNTNIHQYGRKYTTEELTQRVTGDTIQSDPYMAYLTDKYTEVYGL